VPSLFDRLTGGLFRRGPITIDDVPYIVRAADPTPAKDGKYRPQPDNRSGFSGVAEKSYAFGSTSNPYEDTFGHDPTRYAPSDFGNYEALSVAVYACVSKRAKSLAKLPPKLYKISASGKKSEVTTGRCFALLQSVNPFWSWGRLIRMTVHARLLWGTSYWCLERGPGGKGLPTEIWWARPDRMKVIPHPTDYIAGYIYEAHGNTIPWHKDEVIWLPKDNPVDEYSGLSPISAARMSIDLGQSALRSNKNIFDQGMQLGGVITPSDPEETFTPKQREDLEESFARRFKGGDKTHKWAVLGGDVKITPLGMSPQDAEFLGQMRWALNDVCRVFDIPPEMVGDHEHATYSNIEQAHEHFWGDTILSDAAEIAEGVTEQFLPIFHEADIMEFDISGIAALQEDRGQLVTQMSKLWAMGVPLNPLLQEFAPQLLPIGAKGYKWGDVWWAPGTLTPIDSAEKPLPPAPPTPEPKPEDQGGNNPGDEQAQDGKETQEGDTPSGDGSTEGTDNGSASEGAGKALALLEKYATEQRAKAITDEARAKAIADDPLMPKLTSVLQELMRRQQDAVISRVRSGKAEMPFDQAQWGKEFKQGLYRVLIQGQDTRDPEFARYAEGASQRAARFSNVETFTRLKERLDETPGAPNPFLCKQVRAIYRERATECEEIAKRIIGEKIGTSPFLLDVKPTPNGVHHVTVSDAERKARTEALKQFPKLVAAMKDLAAPRLRAEVDDYLDDQKKRVIKAIREQGKQGG
jgi:HK97 family phage portal protein